MLKSRMKRLTIERDQAVIGLAAIKASVCALNNEDVLDLADIFAHASGSPLAAMAAAEMEKRNLSL